ncbi:MAG: DUF4347 domain-containing protein, partial [Halieaceae bacterium]
MNWKKRYRKLEERVLLDAAGAVTIADSADDISDDIQESAREQLRLEQEELTSLVAALGETQDNAETGDAVIDSGPEILFVDSQVDDIDQLLANLADDVEVYFIEPEDDGVAFIADVLSNSDKNYAAVHIVSHGDSGELRLGNATLTADSMAGDALSHLQSWGENLTDEADILIYGCSVAEGDTGLAFVQQLAEITGADIAASVDDTGAAALGGDWDLEVTAGAVEAELAIGDATQRSWGNLLALTVESRNDLGGDAAADQTLAEALAPTGSGVNLSTITFSGDNEAIALFNDLEDASSGSLMGNGVVISTGLVDNLIGDATVGNTTSDNLAGASDVDDAELDASSAAEGIDFDQFDVTTFEFGFTPDPGITKLALTYVFSTEETYQYAVNQDFTDLFGIYVKNNEVGQAYNELVFNNLRELHQGADPNVVLNDNTATDTGDNVEMNWVTTQEVQVLDLNVLPGSDSTYSIKFALADQEDSALNSAAFFDWIGSAIRIDLDADDSSGAVDQDFDTSFDASLVTPVPTVIVDSDLYVENYDTSTSITSIFVDLNNASGSDALAVNLAGLSNISVVSNTGSSIELAWTGTTGDPNNVAEITAALQAITYSNNDGLNTNPDDRVIEIYLSDGETNSGVVSTTIDMLRVVETPTVNALSTSSSQPTLSGTFDETNAATLQITVDGTLYTYNLAGSPPAGLTTDGSGNWTLDLAVAGQTLADGSYEVTAYNENADANATDTSSNELLVASGGALIATDDTLTVGEDDSVTAVPATGVLSNDLFAMGLDPARPALATTGAGGSALYSNFDASLDTDNDGSWDDSAVDGTGNLDRTWEWAGNKQPIAVTGSSVAGITYAFDFDGTEEAAISGRLNGGLSENSANFEFWLKLDSGLTTGTNYIIVDMGDANEGFTLAYRPTATGNGEFVVYFDDDDSGTNGTSILSLGSDPAFDPTSDFLQLVLSFDDVNEQILWHINGQTAAAAGLTVTGASLAIDDWAKEEDGEDVLGGVGEQIGGSNAGVVGPTANFVGEIAVMRLYGHDTNNNTERAVPLSDTDIQNNYLHFTQTTGASVTEVNAVAGNVGSVVVGSGGGNFIVNADGSYSYDPNGAFEYLGPGDTATDFVTYTIDDGSSTDTATLTVTVTGVDDAPAAPGAALGVGVDDNDTPLGLTVPGVAPNSLDPDDPDVNLTITVTALPSEGTITLASGTALTVGQTLTVSQLQGLEYDAPGSGSYGGAAISDFTYEVDDGYNLPVEGVVTISIDGFIPEPTVVSQTTIEQSPTLTGTFDGIGAETLTIIVDPGGPEQATYTAIDIQTSPVLDTGLVIDTVAGTWTLDLGVASQVLPEGSYDIEVTNTKDSGATTATDTSSAELVVDYIEIPTVDGLTTNIQSPVLTGSFDEANGASLTLDITDPDGPNDYGTYTLGDPGFSSDGFGNWTLDLSVADGAGGSAGTVLADAETYDIDTSSSGGGVTQVDVTAAELVVDTSLIETAVDDTLTVTEDDSLVAIPADGLITNDFNVISTLDTSLQRDYVAADDIGGNDLWTDNNLLGINWDFGSPVSQNTAPGSNYPGITESYNFDLAGATSTIDWPGADTEASHSFEFWVKPGDVGASTLTSGTEYLVFEAGDTAEGFSVTYTYNAGADDVVTLYYDDDDSGTTATLSLNVAAAEPPDEFLQITAVFNDANDSIQLHIDGGTASGFGDSATVSPGADLDWSDTDDAGLGTVAGNLGAGSIAGTPSDFLGEMAIVRVYDGALSTADVNGNFGAVADHFYVSAVDNGGAPQGLTEPPGSSAPDSVTITGSNGGQFVIYSDGGYSYDPNGVTPDLFQSLGDGDSATDTVNYTVTDIYGNSDSATLTVTIDGINDAPAAPGNTLNVGVADINTPLAITAVGVAPNSLDIDDIDSSLTITVTALPSEGEVTLGTGAAVTLGQTLTVAQLLALQYDSPNSAGGSYAGAPITDFTYTVDDGTAPPVEGVVAFNITGFINEPSVVSQTTVNQLPTITGSFNSAAAATLTVEIFDAGTSNSLGLYTLGAAGFSNVGDDWTLDLAAVGLPPSLVAGSNYDVEVFVDDGSGGTATDPTSSELIIEALGPSTVNNLITSSTSPTLTGSFDEADAQQLTVEIFLDDGAGGPGAALAGPYTLSGTAALTSDGSGNWTLDLN